MSRVEEYSDEVEHERLSSWGLRTALPLELIEREGGWTDRADDAAEPQLEGPAPADERAEREPISTGLAAWVEVASIELG